MNKVMAFVKKSIICIVVMSGLCVQYFYAPSYWTFVLLEGVSLLERKAHVKIALMVLVACAYVFMHIQTRKLGLISGKCSADNFSRDHVTDKLVSTEWRGSDDVFVLKLDSEKEERFVKLVHKLYNSYNAIIFSCKI